MNFHAVEIDRDLGRDDPLYVGNFFALKGMWWRKRKQRQGLILSIATAWYRLVKQNPSAPGFINEDVLITSLTRQVKDAKVILARFFDISRIGFNFHDGNKSPTQITPRKLNRQMIAAIEAIIHEVKFSPGAEPIGKNLISSDLEVRAHRTSYIRAKLKEENREDLLPAVNWLLKQEGVIKFYYEPAGKLLARDKSIWPVRSIEMWPGWLRTELFGTVVDIENSYVQFVVAKLEEKYRANIKRLELKYPDLLRADRDKQNFREELCRDFLRLEPTDENINHVKKVLMALANGSNATRSLMTSGSGRSEAVRIVLQANPSLLPSELIAVGDRLHVIAQQFKNAKKALCIHLLNAKPTRDNQRQIFRRYLLWERESRYAIHEAVSGTGLHLHDGIDGVKTDLSDGELVEHIFKATSLKVSVTSPDESIAA